VLILIRHGQSTSNVEGLLAGRLDSPLTDVGRAQARALAPSLTDVSIAITSPLDRARETARLALPHLTATVDDAFIELDHGTEEGRPFAEFLLADWRTFRGDSHFRVGGGESLADVDARVQPRLTALEEEYRDLIASSTDHIAIVSHVSPIKSGLAWALGIKEVIAWNTRLDNASLTRVSLRGDDRILVSFNDTSVRREVPTPTT
jgi:broad specificity phosphatase PhoE